MTTENTEGSNAADEQLLTQFGYKQELKRTLKLFSMFAISFSVISVTTGIFTNFAFATSEFGAASIWLWPVAALGALILSFVLAELASRIPLAGYSYQWGGRLVGRATAGSSASTCCAPSPWPAAANAAAAVAHDRHGARTERRQQGPR